MRLTVEIKNLKSGGTSYFDFPTARECNRFVHEIESDVYAGKNRHVREVTETPYNVTRSFIIYTSIEDVEQVTVKTRKT